MSGEGTTPTIEEQIAALVAQTAANAEKLRALEAENAAIRATNEELRAMVDGVVPDSEDMGNPVPVLNAEQEVDRRGRDAPTAPGIPDVNPNVGQTQQTPQTARVNIDLNNLPVRNDNEQDPVMSRQPETV